MTFGVDHIVSGVAINILAARRRPLPRRSIALRRGARAAASRSRRRSTQHRGRVTLPVLSATRSADLARHGTGSSSPTSPASLAGRHHERLATHAHRRPARPGDLPTAVAHGVRPAAALLRREPGRRRVPRRQRLPRSSTSPWSSPAALAGLGGAFLPSRVAASTARARPRPRLHRPGRDDLRQLAARRPGRRRGLFGFTDALQLRSGGDVGPRAAAARRASLLAASWAIWICSAASGVAGGRSALAFAVAARLVVPRHRRRCRRRLPFVTPHVTTLLVLALASQRLRTPEADGLPYRRGRGLTCGVPSLDWDALRAAAVEVMQRAYAPYSHFQVGVAGLVDDGRIVVGLQRRERLLRPGPVRRVRPGVGAARDRRRPAGRGRRASTGTAHALMPCGRCRQLLWENGGAGHAARDGPRRAADDARCCPTRSARTT